jgi:parallel beta-helix repeat protein
MQQIKISTIKSVFILAAFLWLLPTVVEAVNCDTDGPGALQAAINAAGTGDTIPVSGTCNENVSIREGKNRITLDGGGVATIDGPDATAPTVQVRGNGITIKNFASITGGEDGISIHRGGTVRIAGNTIQFTERSGINLAQEGSAQITNNIIQNNPLDGIHVGFSSSARIGFLAFEGLETVPIGVGPNTIQSNGRDGIRVTNHGAAQIIDNTISNNTNDGVRVQRMSWALISSNTIDSNGANGVFVLQNSGVNLGADTGTELDELPNSTTVNNTLRGLRCRINSYADGRRGTLNGAAGATSFGSGCVNSTIP